MLTWFAFWLIVALLVVWRRPIFGYLEGRPYLSDELRRFINKQTALRRTLFITDKPKRDKNWVCDLCGATAVTPQEFMSLKYTPEAVVSIANEKRMCGKYRNAFYTKLWAVPVVVRVRNRWTSVVDDTKEFDALSTRRVMSGNLVLYRDQS
jgi:hypothetical protein